jgi:hypothetical protein
MPSDADTQLAANGSRREVMVDMSTVVSVAHPQNYATRRHAPHMGYADSYKSLPGVSKVQLRPAPLGVPNASLMRALRPSPAVACRRCQTPWVLTRSGCQASARGPHPLILHRAHHDALLGSFNRSPKDRLDVHPPAPRSRQQQSQQHHHSSWCRQTTPRILECGPYPTNGTGS